MFRVFESIFVGAKPLMDLIDAGRGWLAAQVESAMTPGPLRSLLADGVIKGVGSVLVFLPQIMILFAFIAVLEDCGYMARAAFLMDKLMAKCGLNGKSFIPLLSSVACAVPGIMATRVIENRRDRLATILVAPLMSCSARLPLYMLLIGAFLSDPWWLPGLALFGMYMIGFTVAPLVALLLKRTLLRGETPVFVMEMPAFKVPQVRAVGRRMFGAGWAFISRAGTMILASMILIWASLYFTTESPGGRSYDRATSLLANEVKNASGDELETKKQELDALNGQWKRESILGSVGRELEPAFRPLGWDWKIGMSALASFPAREVVVGTLGHHLQSGRRRSQRCAEVEKRGRIAVGQDDSRGMVQRSQARKISDAGGIELARFLCTVLPVCFHAHGDLAGNAVVVLARVHVYLHDRVGLYRGARYFPDRPCHCWLRNRCGLATARHRPDHPRRGRLCGEIDRAFAAWPGQGRVRGELCEMLGHGARAESRPDRAAAIAIMIRRARSDRSSPFRSTRARRCNRSPICRRTDPSDRRHRRALGVRVYRFGNGDGA